MEQVQTIFDRSANLPSTNDPEEVMIEAARRGDRHAIDCLITRHRNGAVRLAMVTLHHSGEAEDAAQEAFIRAFRNLGSYRGGGRFSTWLYRIVVRVCIDRMRLARWSSEAGDECIAESSSAQASDYNSVELKIVVEQLLRELSAPMRAMLVLRELEGLEYSEIASVLNIPVGRVKFRLHTARKQFQQLWTRIESEAEHV